MDIRPVLQLKNKKTGLKERYQMDQDCIQIGRNRSNFIVLEDRTVSRTHAEILHTGEQFFIQDLGSNNGTLLNQHKLPPKEKILLHAGDTLQIDDYELCFQLPSSANTEDLYETTDTDILEIKMVKKLLKAMDKEQSPSLEVMEGELIGTRFVFEGKNQDVLIGRDPACEFALDSDVISRKHVRFIKRWDAVKLLDMGSKNGCYVNREKVKEAPLKDGDIIHLGTLALMFRNPQELSLDIIAPIKPKQETPPPLPIPTLESRAVGKKTADEEPPAPIEEPAESLPSPEQETVEPVEEDAEASVTAVQKFQLSWVEILFGLIGLGVFGISIWGIWTLLR